MRRASGVSSLIICLLLGLRLTLHSCLSTDTAAFAAGFAQRLDMCFVFLAPASRVGVSRRGDAIRSARAKIGSVND